MADKIKESEVGFDAPTNNTEDDTIAREHWAQLHDDLKDAARKRELELIEKYAKRPSKSLTNLVNEKYGRNK